jgi:hypothetical protein
VLESKYGSPKIVNDGVTVAKEVELEDPVENIGAKLVRQVPPVLCNCTVLPDRMPQCVDSCLRPNEWGKRVIP